MYSFLVDDLSGGFTTRHEGRLSVEKLLSEPLRPLSDAEARRERDEKLRAEWGMTPDAIASQDDSFWGP